MRTLRPELVIADEGRPETAFARIDRLAVDSRGHIYVPQRLDPSVRVFDANGRFLRYIGRRGRGPGEFEGLETIGLRGDSLWTFDRALQRLTLFTPSGEYARAVSVAAAALPRDVYARPVVLGWPSDNSMLVYFATRPDVLARSRTEQREAFVDVAPPATMRDSMWLDADHGVYGIPQPSGRAQRPGTVPADILGFQPFPADALLRVASRGGGVLVVDRPAAATSGPDSFGLIRLRTVSDTIFARSVSYVPVRLPQEVRDSALSSATAELREIFQGHSDRGVRSAIEERLYLPANYPPVIDAVAGEDGSSWIQLRTASHTQATWYVFDDRGHVRWRVEIPLNLRPLAVDGERVWAVHSGPDGIPAVLRLHLEQLTP